MLRALARALAFAGALSVSLAARSAIADTGSAHEPERGASAPSAAELGWFGVSVGLGSPSLKTTLGDAEPSSSAEGSAGSAGNFRLLYEKQLFRWIGLRGFVSSTEWGTELSERSGDGDRALHDLGGAPVLSYGASRRVSLFAFAPLSFSWSSAPAHAERQVVLESMNVGTGYRIGVGVGMLLRFSGSLGLSLELEAASQRVDHVRRYARVDGSGGAVELPITYDLRWLGIELGLAIFP